MLINDYVSMKNRSAFLSSTMFLTNTLNYGSLHCVIVKIVHVCGVTSISHSAVVEQECGATLLEAG